MGRLFNTGEINSMVPANRFVHAVTWTGMATDEGACTSDDGSSWTRLIKARKL